MQKIEHVLVVPAKLFDDLGRFQGFSASVYHYLPSLLDPVNLSYMPRPAAEVDPNFKQLIPYVIFRYRHPDAGCSFFAYTRGKGQGESRLHSKRSIGVGGHISSDDSASQSPYNEGMCRELAEEVNISTPHSIRIVGLINDDETEVGKVHLGIVHLVDVEQPNVTPREDDICDAGFVSWVNLQLEIDRLESWSRYCLQAIGSGLFDLAAPPDAE